ncbi:protein-disulfide reductase DsbD family protein [Luteimonas kalidii]|uniref:Protein-disulfide reductase DsbD family protein n=1 Tax=Luteimonas kalidii TaxID=3042025 RepID=A0ABT6JX85_9GAMM|nr:protein-disulfide reductase DsbD [Luteimonas kalidii]MDH5835202.1 protein-disulfide reductase DsbD family protein [Luteimonas kalidii]
MNATRGLAWRLYALLALLLAALPAAAVDDSQLLPVDQAFALEARATARGRVELEWTIAEGYYLYRHRISVREVGGGFKSNPLQLPAGKRHVDEFFGEVETYRQRLVGVFTGAAADGTTALRLEVKYQGCADLGICYPPQTRMLQVPLPGADASAPGSRPAAASAAVAARDPGFAALGRALSGTPGAAATPLTGTDAAGRSQALPLPPEQAFGFEAIADGGDGLLLRFTPAPGYYLYRDRSRFEVSGADGTRAGAPRWPDGAAHRDAHFGEVVVYFEQVDIPLPLRRGSAGPAHVQVTATFQGCQDEGICYPPMTRTVQVALPAGTLAVEAAATAPDAGAGPDSLSPASTDDRAGLDAEDGGGPVATASTTPMPDAAAATPAGGLRGPAPDASADNAARTRPPGVALPAGGVFGALLLALLGGLVLNLMPCVLPILSLKVLGLAQSGESRARARSHALWYTLGVLVAFAAVGGLVLALRAGGQALGWGFQLQQPWFVAALVYVMFAVGLSLSGVFTLGGGLGSVGQSLAARTGPAGDFFTGVLACVVASPCIAPFMGGALAFAFTASPLLALAVFLMLGLGLALPFLLIGLVPALAERLPRPGAWMETLKQVLAFPMYLTAIWLLWVLGQQRGVDAMALVAAGLALFALGLWWHERRRWTGSTLGRALALLLVAAALFPVWKVHTLVAPARVAEVGDAQRHAWTPTRLQALRGEGRAVFVNMTADWCVTCKANERRVLSQPAFRDALRAADAAYLVGDYTDADPEIAAFLERHRAVGVPLYVVYPSGGGEGEVLPALLSDAVVVAALERAAR